MIYDYCNLNKDQKKKVIKKIREGSVFIVMTDTIYGLSCSLDNSASLNRIKKVKMIKEERPFIALVSNLEMLKKNFILSKEQGEYIVRNSESPTSFVVDSVNDLFRKGVGVAVRLPKRKILANMIDEIGQALISTSCNISGEKQINNLKDLNIFYNKNAGLIDFIIKFKGEKVRKRPSRVVDIRDLKNIKIIR